MTLNPVTNSRLTVVEQLTYQAPGEHPEVCETRVSRLLSSSEQPFRRTVNLEPDKWTPVPYDWIDPTRCGMLEIMNPAPMRTTIPTEAEKEETAKRIVEVGFLGAGGVATLCSIPPQESIRIPNPTDLGVWYVKSSVKMR